MASGKALTEETFVDQVQTFAMNSTTNDGYNDYQKFYPKIEMAPEDNKVSNVNELESKIVKKQSRADYPQCFRGPSIIPITFPRQSMKQSS